MSLPQRPRPAPASVRPAAAATTPNSELPDQLPGQLPGWKCSSATWPTLLWPSRAKNRVALAQHGNGAASVLSELSGNGINGNRHEMLS